MGITYRNKGGTYQDLEGNFHSHGALLESDLDLCAKFPNSFEVVHTVTAPVAPTLAPVVIAEDDADEEADALPEGHTDVTDKFPEAVKHDIRVTRDKAGWWMHDGDEIQNETPLKQKEVTPFIKEYFGEK